MLPNRFDRAYGVLRFVNVSATEHTGVLCCDLQTCIGCALCQNVEVQDAHYLTRLLASNNSIHAPSTGWQACKLCLLWVTRWIDRCKLDYQDSTKTLAWWHTTRATSAPRNKLHATLRHAQQWMTKKLTCKKKWQHPWTERLTHQPKPLKLRKKHNSCVLVQAGHTHLFLRRCIMQQYRQYGISSQGDQCYPLRYYNSLNSSPQRVCQAQTAQSRWPWATWSLKCFAKALQFASVPCTMPSAECRPAHVPVRLI